MVFGSHYTNDSGAGRLPKQISGLGRVYTQWTQQSTAARFDAAYDIWFDPSGYPGNRAAQDELMIWVNWKGTNPLAETYDANGAVPYAKSVVIGGKTWNVYHKLQNGGDVMSFLQVGGSANTSISINAKVLIDYCVQRGWLVSTEYMTSIQTGWEIIDGGTFKTTNFSIDTATI